ncbi:MAG: RidA family protein [Tissierellia bacterium]|nr:RidA family protein [Tissierellia bacterium]
MKKENPIPQGKYLPAKRFGNLIYTAGMTPRVQGRLLMTGKVRTHEPLVKYKKAMEQAANNALMAARNLLKEGEEIEAVLTMTVYINGEEGYQDHAKLADFATDYLYEELGEVAIGTRAAIGVASLPGDAPVEIQLVLGLSL